MSTSTNWFETDRRGLLQILQRRGKSWALMELTQNAWDAGATEITVTLEPKPGSPKVTLVVEDNAPGGFTDLAHTYTLFAPSSRKANPEQRGRFNLGCKLVLALCASAQITSTRGGYRFDEKGRHASRATTRTGSRFEGLLTMTRDELADVRQQLRRLMPPPGVKMTITALDAEGVEDQEVLASRCPTVTFSDTLQTEIADDEGVLRRVPRKTKVFLYATQPGEQALLFEMGIPVMEIEGPWHIEVGQKLPLGLDRDAVPPAYLIKLQALVLNQTAHLLAAEQFAAPWVSEAVQHAAVEPEAVAAYVKGKYGDKVVINDPKNLESVRKAQAAGYTVIYGRAEGTHTFEVMRNHGLVQPAGQVFPPPGVTSNWELVQHPTNNYLRAAAFSAALAKKLLGLNIKVRIIDGPTCHAATWLRDPVTPELTFNVAVLGPDFFQDGPDDVGVMDLLLHELAHQYGDHLEEKFDDAMSSLGAKLFMLARQEPRFFDFQGWYAPPQEGN